MNISIGARIQPGPFGGGNQVARLLAAHLESAGHRVCFDLRARDLDVVLMMEPRSIRFSAYTDRHIFAHLRRNPRAVVVHRVNECDERKGTVGVNARLMRANLCADHTVFVSAWLRDLLVAQGMPCPSTSVIRNGSDPAVFRPDGGGRWDGIGPLKLVTHHWGANWRKGFDVYQKLDRMMADPAWRGRVEFCYIGNLPRDFAFEHARYVEPCGGGELAARLREHHVYVTASRCEPGSNHQNEGALCGLPLLYLADASMPEYCEGFGIAFGEGDFEPRLEQMMAEYSTWADRMAGYPHTSARMLDCWAALFDDLAARRDELLAARLPGRERQWLRRTVTAGIQRRG